MPPLPRFYHKWPVQVRRTEYLKSKASDHLLINLRKQNGVPKHLEAENTLSINKDRPYLVFHWPDCFHEFFQPVGNTFATFPEIRSSRVDSQFVQRCAHLIPHCPLITPETATLTYIGCYCCFFVQHGTERGTQTLLTQNPLFHAASAQLGCMRQGFLLSSLRESREWC